MLLRDSSSSQLPKTPASRQQNVAAKIMTKSSSNSSKSSSKWRGWNNDSKWVKRRNERKGRTFQSAANQWKLLRITVNSKAHFPRWARLCWWSPFYFKVQVRKIMLLHFIRLRHIWNHLRSNHESIFEGLVCWQNVKLYNDFLSFFCQCVNFFLKLVVLPKIKFLEIRIECSTMQKLILA